MPNTTLTQMGLDYASSASPVGTLIAPVYWVPVYDYRIDSLIHDSTIPTSAFSACANVSATEPFGERIWNVSGADRYTLSDNNESFIISTGTSSASGGGNITNVLNPAQSQKWQINLLNDVPLSDHWTGTSATFDGVKWQIADCTMATGSNPTPSGRDKFFQVIDYYPVSADAGDSHTRGNIKCRLAKDIGDVKFNKVALYITQYNASGVESLGEPVFFAEVNLKTTVVKTSMGTNGFDDITVDCQLDLHSLSANWSDVFFSTSGDYWARTQDGVYYPERVGIGSFHESIASPQASLHVRRTRAMVGLGITDAPVARFDYDDTNYVQYDIDQYGNIHQTFESDNGSMGLYYAPGISAIYPDIDNGIGLGISSNRFKDINVGGEGLDILNSGDSRYIQGYFTESDGGWIRASDDVRMTFDEFGSDPLLSKLAYVRGADINRVDEALLTYTIYDTATTPALYMVAGVSNDTADWASLPSGQTGLTHLNLLYRLENNMTTPDAWLDGNSKAVLIGRGGIDTYGPLQLDALLSQSTNVFYEYSTVYTRRNKILFIADVNTAADIKQLISFAHSDTEGNWDALMADTDLASEFQFAGKIRHIGNIEPIYADTDTDYASVIGVPGLKLISDTVIQTQKHYKRLFVKTIGAYNNEVYAGTVLYSDNRVDNLWVKEIGSADLTTSMTWVNRQAIWGLLNFNDALDIGNIASTTSSPTAGDAEFPTTQTAYKGLWPKRYISLGNLTDFAYSLTNNANARDGAGGKTIWDAYINNIYVSHKIKFQNGVEIWGSYSGDKTAAPVDINSGSNASAWPGIHNTSGGKFTLGDPGKPLDSAYINFLQIPEFYITSADVIAGVTSTDRLVYELWTTSPVGSVTAVALNSGSTYKGKVLYMSGYRISNSVHVKGCIEYIPTYAGNYRIGIMLNMHQIDGLLTSYPTSENPKMKSSILPSTTRMGERARAKGFAISTLVETASANTSIPMVSSFIGSPSIAGNGSSMFHSLSIGTATYTPLSWGNAGIFFDTEQFMALLCLTLDASPKYEYFYTTYTSKKVNISFDLTYDVIP